MAELNPVKFLLNQGGDGAEAMVVEAPAFSLTKVMTAGAVIVTPLATLVIEKLNDEGLRANQLVVIAVGLLGFLAITAAADVLARAIATAAEKNAVAAVTSIAQFSPFKAPLPGTRVSADAHTPDPAVDVLAAAQGDVAYFLVREGDKLSWWPASEIAIAPALV